MARAETITAYLDAWGACRLPMPTLPHSVRTQLDTRDGGVRVTLLEPGVA